MLPTTRGTKARSQKARGRAASRVGHGSKSTPRPSNIFISYRRDDSAAHARHLFESLAARFGEERVFFDQSAIEPGTIFPKRIAEAIAASGVILVVIGRRWFERVDRAAEPRISDARDWVRREIELGLRNSALVIPVLVDGAAIPDKHELPASLAGLPTLNAVTIHWHENIDKMSKTIAEVTDSNAPYDLTVHLRNRPEAAVKRATMLTAMEISLAHQGETVRLDDQDLAKKFEKATKRPLEHGMQMNEIMYVIDRVGIAGRTARGARRTYTARAYRLKSYEQIPTELEKGRPIVAGVMVYRKWWSRSVTKTGRIEDWKKPGFTQGAIVTAIVGFDPGDGSVRFMTPYPNWGQQSLGTLTVGAAKRFLEADSMYSIEAAEAVTLR